MLRALKLLEQRFGRIGDLIDGSQVLNVASSSAVEREHLEELFSHKVCAIHIESWFPKETSAVYADWILREGVGPISDWQVGIGKGLESTDVKVAGGIPYNMMIDRGENAKEEYFQRSLLNIRKLREGPGKMAGWSPSGEPNQFLPIMSPIDKLRLELDDVWPQGATVSKAKDGRPFLPGLARVIDGPTSSVRGFIHVDELAPINTHQGAFSANVYLQLPTEGGELSIWPLSFRKKWDFYRNAPTLSLLASHNPENQRLLRSVLPPPISIAIGPGSLVLLCVQEKKLLVLALRGLDGNAYRKRSKLWKDMGDGIYGAHLGLATAVNRVGSNSKQKRVNMEVMRSLGGNN